MGGRGGMGGSPFGGMGGGMGMGGGAKSAGGGTQQPSSYTPKTATPTFDGNRYKMPYNTSAGGMNPYTNGSLNKLSKLNKN